VPESAVLPFMASSLNGRPSGVTISAMTTWRQSLRWSRL
jgi:hypothetical protein